MKNVHDSSKMTSLACVTKLDTENVERHRTNTFTLIAVGLERSLNINQTITTKVPRNNCIADLQ